MVDRIDIEGVSVPTGHFIGGEHVSSETTFETRCPFDWDWKLADISRGTAETADMAVSAAVDAFRNGVPIPRNSGPPASTNWRS